MARSAKVRTHDTAWTKTMRIDDAALTASGIVVRDIAFYITQRCNLRCKHCYVGNEWLDTQEAFSREEIQIILDHFGTPGLDRLTILGGEPVLHPDITDIILQAAQYDIKDRRMTTNGISLGFLDLSRLSGKELNHISISIDGITADVHERVRGKNTFYRSLRTARLLAEHGFEVHANLTVNGVNKDQVVDAIYFFKEHGFRAVNIHLITMIGNAAENPGLYVSPTEWVRIREQLRAIKDLSGIRVKLPVMFVTVDEYHSLVQSGAYVPPQVRSYQSKDGHRIVLYPNGHVYMSGDLSSTVFNFAVFREGKFTLTHHANELALHIQEPANPDPSTDLLQVDTEGFVRLSVSYKQIIDL